MERPAEKVVEQGGSSLKKVLAMVGAMAALAASSVGTERCSLAKGISLAALSACLATQVKAWKSKVPSCDQKMAKIGIRSHAAFREPEPNAPHTRNPTLKVEPGEGERDIRPRVTRNSNEPGREDDGSDISSRHNIHCSPEGSRHVRTNQVSAMDVEVEGPLREGRLDVLGRRDHLGAEGSILEPLLDSRSTLKAMRASVVEEGIKLMTVEEYEVFKSAPQRVSDAWIKVADEHTLVRVHGKARKGIFQPDHRSLQIPLSKLSEKRTTIAFLPDGKRRVFHDNWHVDQELLWSCPWRGYIIFYIDHAPEEFGGNGSGGSSAAAGSQESREDFSAQIEIGYKKGGPLARAKVVLGIDLSRAEAHAGLDECGTISCGDLGSFGYGSARDPMKPASSHRVPEGMPAVMDLQRSEIQSSTALLEGGIRKWDTMERYANPEEGSTAVSALSFEFGRRATVSKELISRLVESGLMPIRRGDGGGVSMDGSIRDLEGSRFLMTEGEHRFGGWTGL